MFDAPIPGQSLTDEPRNYPWENPPELSTVSETLDFYMEKLTDTDVIDNLLMMLQVGMPVEKITSTLTLGGCYGREAYLRRSVISKSCYT